MSPVPHGSSLKLKSPLELAVRGLLRHPFWIALAVLAAIGAGVVAASVMGKKRYVYQGKMFYTPNRVTEPYYVSPSLRDLQLAIVQKPFLQELHQRFEIDEDFLVFAYRLRFEVNGSASLDVMYTDRDPDRCDRIVDGAMATFLDRSKDLRQKQLGGFIKDFQREIELAEERLVQSRDQLAQSLRPLGMSSEETLQNEISRLRESLVSHTSELEAAVARRDLSRSQVQSLVDLREGDSDNYAAKRPPSTDDQSPGKDSAEPPESAREQTLASYDSQMQRLLEDRIRREREDSSFQVQIDVKQREYERARSLRQRDLISEAAFDKVKGELEVLRAQKNSQIRELESQLGEVTRRINVRTQNLASLAPTAAANLMANLASSPVELQRQTEALLRGSEKAANLTIAGREELLGRTKRDLARLVSLRDDVETEIRDVELAKDRLNQLRDLRDEFARASRSNQTELAIAQPATRLLEGEKNNYAKWFAVASVGTLGLLIGPLFLIGLMRAARMNPGGGDVFGVPVVGEVPKARRGDDAAAIRQRDERLALRLAQRCGDAGVIGLMSDNREVGGNLAACLKDYFQSIGEETHLIPAETLRSTDPDAEALQHAAEAITRARAGQGRVLVESPFNTDPLIGDIAATTSDRLLVTMNRRSQSSPATQRRFAELASLDTQVVGAVLRD